MNFFILLLMVCDMCLIWVVCLVMCVICFMSMRFIRNWCDILSFIGVRCIVGRCLRASITSINIWSDDMVIRFY